MPHLFTLHAAGTPDILDDWQGPEDVPAVAPPAWQPPAQQAWQQPHAAVQPAAPVEERERSVTPGECSSVVHLLAGHLPSMQTVFTPSHSCSITWMSPSRLADPVFCW